MQKVPNRFIRDIVAPACCNNEAIIKAFEAVPRGFFADDGVKSSAYSDNALPIGMGQTLSKASTVARMLLLLDIAPTDTILEIGSGSGFLTSLLSKLARSVYAVERIPALLEKGKAATRALGIRNAFFKLDNGNNGWKEFAPYDKIVASASAEKIPPALVQELKDGGLIVIPIKNNLMRYQLTNGTITETTDISVSFVKFVDS